jgi:hypothetical protein
MLNTVAHTCQQIQQRSLVFSRGFLMSAAEVVGAQPAIKGGYIVEHDDGVESVRSSGRDRERQRQGPRASPR